VIVIVIDFLVFVFSDTHKNESQEYQFNGENSTARYGYAFILSYTSRNQIVNVKINSDSTAVFSYITAPNTRRTGQRVRQAFGRMGDNPPGRAGNRGSCVINKEDEH
ncbi:MAG: hypothetical protein KKG76_13975, partial [Euryarchaeota archaeon]|nr:hypothetical protein [Euryarchaeota archaeon]